jgi:hypothetical protein
MDALVYQVSALIWFFEEFLTKHTSLKSLNWTNIFTSYCTISPPPIVVGKKEITCWEFVGVHVYYRLRFYIYDAGACKHKPSAESICIKKTEVQ